MVSLLLDIGNNRKVYIILDSDRKKLIFNKCENDDEE